MADATASCAAEADLDHVLAMSETGGDSLYGAIDFTKVRALNEAEAGSAVRVFKPWAKRAVRYATKVQPIVCIALGSPTPTNRDDNAAAVCPVAAAIGALLPQRFGRP
jgi:hypothetical protein